ncbi:MAG: CocE/NonD family hydrolase [Candidatus Omnitrophota bacterium]|jgi:predicted acyl esterase|nr:MAG: CocE/NonD family hydrolase [Candidatus Omnitrophota bacterium]
MRMFMKRFRVLFVFLTLIALPIVAEPQEAAVYRVEMRDGVELATDVYLPSEGKGSWPVVLGRTPYSKKSSADLASLTERGIAVVIQDVRGRFDSGGFARPFADDGWGERQDGYDTVHWIRAQAWCNGKIATVGGSAGGITQIQLAGSAPEGLAGQLIVVAPLSGYHSTFFMGGVFRKSLVEGWLKGAKWPDENLAEIRFHPAYDEYWQVQNLGERIEEVNWPISLVGGWFDIFQQGTIDAFVDIRNHGGSCARENAHLIMGPWHHGVNVTKVGELTFPDTAKTPALWPGQKEWLEHWLSDQPLDPAPPPVLYYTMGELPAGNAPGNEWRSCENWPPDSMPHKYYLCSDGGLSENPPEASVRTYTYDPKNPVPTIGGQNLLLPMGPHDQRSIEQRDDVLVFSTPPLSEPLEVTGRITATLYVSTNAVDTDFTAKLTDVYPDGRSMLLNDGIRKLSFRHSLISPTAVVPGKIYQLEIDLWSTSIVFNTGHCIRLAISSSNSPRFEANPNTGFADWRNTETVAAEQSIYIGGECASYLLLPVIGK